MLEEVFSKIDVFRILSIFYKGIEMLVEVLFFVVIICMIFGRE